MKSAQQWALELFGTKNPDEGFENDAWIEISEGTFVELVKKIQEDARLVIPTQKQSNGVKEIITIDCVGTEGGKVSLPIKKP